MKKLNIQVSDIFSTSGYAQHSKEFALAMSKLYDVCVEVTSQPIQNWQNKVPDALRKMILKEYENEPTIMINTPNAWQYKLGHKAPKIGFGIFEGSKIPFSWAVSANEYVDRVFVPSQHTKESFVNGGVEDSKIDIIPHGVDRAIFNPEAKPDEELKKEIGDRFCFYFNGGWSQGVRDRKGLHLALRAFAEEFKPDEKVIFIAKINGAYVGEGWNVYTEIGKLNLPKTAQIKIRMGNFTNGELASYYTASDVHVITPYSESFCLPLLESLSCGKPVITSTYGGQMDFCNKKNSWLVETGDEIPAMDANPIYHEGTTWRVPKISSIRKQMRTSFEGGKNKEYLSKSKEAIETAKKFTWDASALKAQKALSKLF